MRIVRQIPLSDHVLLQGRVKLSYICEAKGGRRGLLNTGNEMKEPEEVLGGVWDECRMNAGP